MSTGGSGSRGVVFVVDDHEDSREIEATFIRTCGLEVKELADAESALAALEEKVPVLLVTDVTLPGMDGLDLVKRFRADARTARIPVIVLTGRTDVSPASFDALLVKPFSPTDLVVKVRALLGLPAGG